MTIFATGEYSYRSGGGPGGAVQLPPSLLPSSLPHPMHVSSTYRTPFSRYSSRSHSIPMRCLRSPTPSLSYYRRALSVTDLDQHKISDVMPRSSHINKYNIHTESINRRKYRSINENEDVQKNSVSREKSTLEARVRANYRSVLEDTIDIQNKYKNMGHFDYRNIDREYSAYRPGYSTEDKPETGVFLPLHDSSTQRTRQENRPAPNSLSERTEKSTRNISERFVKMYREATEPPAATRSFSFEVRNPYRYLAANLSTDSYKSRSSYRSPEMRRKAERINPGPVEDNSARREANQGRESSAFSSTRIPREIRLAEETLKFVQNYSVDKLNSRQAYGRPYYETPFVIGI